MGVASLVLMLLLGLTVLAFYASSLHFWERCTGLLMLETWVILGFSLGGPCPFRLVSHHSATSSTHVRGIWGCSSPHPLVWDQGSKKKQRGNDIRVNVDLASPLGSPWVFEGALGSGSWWSYHWCSCSWPGHTVLVFCANSLLFWGPLHWPAGAEDLGHFGVSSLEVLILFERWAGHWLLSEKVTWPHVRANCPIPISPVPVSEGIEIWQGCQFIRSLVQALDKLLGGVGRFLPCRVGFHMSRLRHSGWDQCSHGLTSRPLESCHRQCLQAACGVLGYLQGAAMELLDGTLNLRHCTRLFTKSFPLGFYLGLVGVVGLVKGGNFGKQVWLTRKTRPGIPVLSHLDPVLLGIQCRDDGKDCFPLTPLEQGERWVSLAIFPLVLGLGEVCAVKAWNLHQ